MVQVEVWWLRCISDTYTVYMDKKEADEFNKDLTGDIGGGIGAEIGRKMVVRPIIRVLPDTQQPGLACRQMIKIVGVNDESTGSWSVNDTVTKFAVI